MGNAYHEKTEIPLDEQVYPLALESYLQLWQGVTLVARKEAKVFSSSSMADTAWLQIGLVMMNKAINKWRI